MVPVILAPGILVKFAPDPVKVSAVILPDAVTVDADNDVAVIIPESPCIVTPVPTVTVDTPEVAPSTCNKVVPVELTTFTFSFTDGLEASAFASILVIRRVLQHLLLQDLLITHSYLLEQ